MERRDRVSHLRPLIEIGGGESAVGKGTAEPIKEDGGKYQPDEDAEYEDIIELVGPNNEDHILSAVRRHRDVIAAWGSGAAVPRCRGDG